MQELRAQDTARLLSFHLPNYIFQPIESTKYNFTVSNLLEGPIALSARHAGTGRDLVARCLLPLDARLTRAYAFQTRHFNRLKH